MLIQVTQEHITKGRRRSSSDCPIACAVTAMGYGLVHVGTVLSYWKGEEEYVGIPPDQALRWIRRFDAGMLVEPFAFLIEMHQRRV